MFVGQKSFLQAPPVNLTKTYPLFNFVEFSQHDLHVGEDEHVADDQEPDVVPDGLRGEVAVTGRTNNWFMASLVFLVQK